MTRRPAIALTSALALAALAPAMAADTPPTSIHMNQIGFEPTSPKRAIVNDPATEPLPWRLLDAKGIAVAQGVTIVVGDDAASGDHVHQIDFSQVAAPGTYRLQVGTAKSRPFPIARRIYAPLKYAALNYFYQLLAQAERLTGAARYREGVVDVMDYALGRNPRDQSYVTGFGANPVQKPHHRFWAHSLDAKMPSPRPGVLSGGPNSTSMVDTVSITMRGKCVGQRCWTDKTMAYTMNEVAINWNAP